MRLDNPNADVSPEAFMARCMSETACVLIGVHVGISAL